MHLLTKPSRHFSCGDATGIAKRKMNMKNVLNEPVEIRLARAKNPATDQETLTILSKDSFWFVRDFVASNPNTPEEILVELSKDSDFRIQAEANRNLNKTNLDQQILYASYQKRKHSPQTNSAEQSLTEPLKKDLDGVHMRGR